MHWMLQVVVLVHVGPHLHLGALQDADGSGQPVYYHGHHRGRHVCTTRKNVTVPVARKEAYTKPVYKKYVERCIYNQMCTGVRLVYETEYRDVVSTSTTTQIVHICCPGWNPGKRSHGCNKPRCSTKCQNGGTCLKPDVCVCSRGFTGRFCESDVDECKEHKPCDQVCTNTFGSYRCACREQFFLEADGQSCRSRDDDGPGFEAKDLNGLSDKQLLEANSTTSNSTSYKVSEAFLNTILNDIVVLKAKLKKMDAYENELAVLQSKIAQLELSSNRTEESGRKCLESVDDNDLI